MLKYLEDGLTKLLNRSGLLETLLNEIDYARENVGCSFSLIAFDIDHFNRINKSYGRNTGDELLRQVAIRLRLPLVFQDGCRKSLSWSLSRIGGDVFAAVVRHGEGVGIQDDLQQVIQAIKDTLFVPFDLGIGFKVNLAVSLGASLYRASDVPIAPLTVAEMLVRDAEIAMHESKLGGRNRFLLYQPSMHMKMARMQRLSNDLRHTLLMRQNGVMSTDLFVAYQPIIDLRAPTSSLYGVEALARWSHPELGLIPPDEFIPLAEDGGMIHDVWKIVFNQACVDYVDWRNVWGEHAPSVFSINLSRAQIINTEIVSQISDSLKKFGIPTKSLQIEITESIAGDDNATKEFLRQLQDLGVLVSLDDFGTGHSSLSFLGSMPIDVIKIDKSFINDAQTSEFKKGLIQVIVQIAVLFNMKVVAEGVETLAQSDLVTSLQCDRGQGYLYGRAMSADSISRWIEEKIPLSVNRLQMEISA